MSGCSSHRTAANRPPSVSPPASAPSDRPAPVNRPSDSGPASSPSRPRVAPAPAPAGYAEEGNASWYGVPFHGRRAANGETYDMYKLTAAHRTLPFETLVRVTNLLNNNSAIVRITDRGPFVDNRIIDLSLGAARELDMVAAGIAPVRIEVLSSDIDPTTGFFTVQVGAFLERANAERLERLNEIVAALAEMRPAFIVQRNDHGAGKGVRGIDRVIGVHGEMECASRLRGAGEQQHQSGLETPCHLGDAVVPNGVSGDVDRPPAGQ